MSKIIIECFGKEAELISFSQNGDQAVVLEFTEEYDGYISLDSITARIKGSSCALDTRRLGDGEYTPRLILSDRTVDLPRLKKQLGTISPMEPERPYVVALSLRERKLCQRVDLLEKRLEEISKKICGSGLFAPLP